MTSLVRRSGAFESPFLSLRREIDSLFPAFTEDGFFASAANATFPAEFVETPEHFALKAELPGLDAKDVEIRVEDGILVISGEKKEEVRKENANVHFTERRYGKWQRAFRLPAASDTSRVEARMVNGVLDVTIAKRAEAKPQTIPVHGN
jgi:HSP20 family protein